MVLAFSLAWNASDVREQAQRVTGNAMAKGLRVKREVLRARHCWEESEFTAVAILFGND
ncbi:hypothetical protein FUAX_04490 [Fulvitalea axinellae]|uniref:Uncharacterized protein n=1 Tax=Fulvitalea axinellae TaxID=1182444 RepID=A0AAU9CRL6_9BACT|nr:hypothetical protein FUAX_04490 [Fulvitalea axinellae]